MANQEIFEMISAVAAGCIDKANFSNFKSFYKSGGDLPEGKLGELQNIVALLALLDEPVQPDPHIKSKVAKRLLSVQTEIKDQIRTEKTKQQIDTKPVSEKPVAPNPPLVNEKINKTADMDDLLYEKLIEEKSVFSDKIGLIVSILSIVLVFLFYFAFNSGISDLEDKFTLLEKTVSTNQKDIKDAQKFVRLHSVLIDFFTEKNIRLVNMNGTSECPDGFAKILLSFQKNEGLLSVKNLPALNEGETFQLWFYSKGISYPVKSFIPQEEANYIHLHKIPYLVPEAIEQFKITIEKFKNAEIPEGKVLLTGSF